VTCAFHEALAPPTLSCPRHSSPLTATRASKKGACLTSPRTSEHKDAGPACQLPVFSARPRLQLTVLEPGVVIVLRPLIGVAPCTGCILDAWYCLRVVASAAVCSTSTAGRPPVVAVPGSAASPSVRYDWESTGTVSGWHLCEESTPRPLRDGNSADCSQNRIQCLRQLKVSTGNYLIFERVLRLVSIDERYPGKHFQVS
jgi:hypothetical protein